MSGGWPGISGRVWHSLAAEGRGSSWRCWPWRRSRGASPTTHIGGLPQAGALVILAIAWTCLAEATAQGPLRAFVVNVVPEVFGGWPEQQSCLRQVWLFLQGRFAGPLGQLGAALRRLVSLRPFPEALMKIAVLFVALVVAYEVPHAGKTLLQPFTALAVNVKEGKAEVPTVSAAGRDRPRRLRSPDQHAGLPDRRPPAGRDPVAPARPGARGAVPDPRRGRYRYNRTPSSRRPPRSTSAASSSRSDPVLTPVLQPVRWLLGVRVVNGSVLADPQGYTVLVRSSTGRDVAGAAGEQEVSGCASTVDGTCARSVPDHAFTGCPSSWRSGS